MKTRTSSSHLTFSSFRQRPDNSTTIIITADDGTSYMIKLLSTDKPTPMESPARRDIVAPVNRRLDIVGSPGKREKKMPRKLSRRV